jgi:vacuolar-type H+-ATPase subunit H
VRIPTYHYLEVLIRSLGEITARGSFMASEKTPKELEETLEEARRSADKLIEEAMRRGSELAKKVSEMRASSNPEGRAKAEKFLRGEIGVEELESSESDREG